MPLCAPPPILLHPYSYCCCVCSSFQRPSGPFSMQLSIAVGVQGSPDQNEQEADSQTITELRQKLVRCL